jgi:asparagine synthase (glutamine-hydrolysing)
LTLFESKKPLRRAAAARFGRRYAHAPKSGFGVPLDAWFASDGPIGRFLMGLMEDRRTRERGWLDVDRVQHLLRAHRRGQRDWSEALWSAMNLELWARVGLEGEAPCELPCVGDRPSGLRDGARA